MDKLKKEKRELEKAARKAEEKLADLKQQQQKKAKAKMVAGLEAVSCVQETCVSR